MTIHHEPSICPTDPLPSRLPRNRQTGPADQEIFGFEGLAEPVTPKGKQISPWFSDPNRRNHYDAPTVVAILYRCFHKDEGE